MRRSLAIAALAALAILPSCGSDRTETADVPAADDRADDASCGTAFPEAPPAPSWPLTVTDDRGVEVTLDEPATRVVTLDWGSTEFVRDLGVQLAGVADLADYRGHASEEPVIGPEVVDVGPRARPNVDAIRALDADLILADTTGPAVDLATLETIAPVLALDHGAAVGVDGMARMLTSFRTAASALDRAEVAEQLVDDLAVTLHSTRQRVAAAGLETTRMAVAQAEGAADAPEFRLFTDASMVWQVAERLCLENAFAQPGAVAVGADDDPGSVVVAPEELAELGDAWLLSAAPTDDPVPFEQLLSTDPRYAAMPFVVADRVRVLPQHAWFFGGPASAMLVAERIADAVNW